jgi:hypothetical protein
MRFRVHEGVLLSFGFPNLLKGNTLASQFPQDSLHHPFISAGSRQFESIGDSFVPTLLISERDGKNLVSATLGRDAKLIVGHGTEENSFVISATQSKSTASLIGPNGKAHWTVP